MKRITVLIEDEKYEELIAAADHLARLINEYEELRRRQTRAEKFLDGETVVTQEPELPTTRAMVFTLALPAGIESLTGCEYGQIEDFRLSVYSLEQQLGRAGARRRRTRSALTIPDPPSGSP
jgi:hypothetical protein